MNKPLEGWKFDQRGGEGWAWSYSDPATGREISRSSRAFATLLECIDDAKRHGYEIKAAR